ncbi:MAG: rhomboid family intramembrane serine protease [Verrucomicrobia bacterium]|nr:rhomboid family intramembrane serine protease [Verrucomicrobiota bacterium]
MDADQLPQVGWAPPEDLPDGAVLDRFSTAREAHEWGLVILSTRTPYWVHAHDGWYYLMVRRQDAALVLPQLSLYAKERGNWPPHPLELPQVPVARDSLWLTAVLLLIAFVLSAQHPFMMAGGRVDSMAIIGSGELWRAITALWLHGDAGHLMGNLLSGAVFCFFVLRYCGYGVGWAAVTLAGVGGNLVNAWFFYPAQHLSIGASTAVFGAVGILAVIPVAVALRSRQRLVLKQSFVPLAGGALLLAWLGTGDARTDIMAHIWGFLGGAFVACAWVMAPQSWFQDSRQKYWARATLAVHALAWCVVVLQAAPWVAR